MLQIFDEPFIERSRDRWWLHPFNPENNINDLPGLPGGIGSGEEAFYDPGNPQADKDGYIAMPNINLPQEMINLNIATRVYQVNVAVLKRYQRMVDNTLELLR